MGAPLSSPLKEQTDPSPKWGRYPGYPGARGRLDLALLVTCPFLPSPFFLGRAEAREPGGECPGSPASVQIPVHTADPKAAFLPGCARGAGLLPAGSGFPHFPVRVLNLPPLRWTP